MWDRGTLEDPSLHVNLHQCAVALGGWGFRQNKLLRDNIKKIRDQIRVAYKGPRPLDFGVIHHLEGRLDSLLLEEEIYWKQRSRENWLKWGDRNTKWFHQKASMRRRKNRIHGVLDDHGCWQSDPSIVKGMFESYFGELFTSSHLDPSDLERVLCHIPTKVSPEMNRRLMERYTREEVEVAIKSFPPTKAPGPNGSWLCFIRNIGILLATGR